MQVSDKLYGTFEITEPVIADLINSKPMQRLKGIGQYGVPDEYHNITNYSRYDHSVGVMLLLRQLGAPVATQIAGLLHDVSHTAFSHTFDWVMGDQSKEDYQDLTHRNFIMNSEIPNILAKHGLDFEEAADTKRHSLLELEIPGVCADRFDYLLRDYYAEPRLTKLCLSNVKAHNGRIVFTSKDVAEEFARTFLYCQRVHWGGIENNIRWYILTQILKLALQEGTINKEDFYKDDNFVIEKIKTSKNMEVQKLLNLLRGKIKFKLVDENPQISVRKKFRYVDPEYLENGILHKLSETDASYKALVEEEKRINEKGIKVNLTIH